MGTTSSSIFNRASKKENSDADVQFMGSRNQPRHRPPGFQNSSPKPRSPLMYFAPEGDRDIKSKEKGLTNISTDNLLSLSPRRRMMEFSSSPNRSFVKRDEVSAPWVSDYSPSPIKSTKTSPYSYKMQSESVLAYPSPNRLHPAEMSYSVYGDDDSLSSQSLTYGDESFTGERAMPIGHRMRSGYYLNDPSSERQFDEHDSCTSISSNRSKRGGYFCNGDPRPGRPKESSYF